VARHTHKRSVNSFLEAFRINVEGIGPSFSFHHIDGDGYLYVFEAPIDFLSFITLYPRDHQAHNYVACCSMAIQPVL